jgi:uncharacterized protein (DUF362 family)
MSRSKVFIVRSAHVISSSGNIYEKRLTHLFSRGFTLLQDSTGQQLFDSFSSVGIKINTLGGDKISTRPELALITTAYIERNYSPRAITIWDRSNRELREAGFRLNLQRKGPLIYGTDTQGIGYNPNLISNRNIGSRLSTIQSEKISSSISLAILKDHGLAGVTAGMKNYFGAIHNPNKYHDFNCNPFIPELLECPAIGKKHRLTILDCLTVQYHRGPSYHARWAERYGALIFSLDPVAADYTGWQVIENLRAKKGLPSLKEEKREPCYLKTAEKMGLGQATRKNIQIIEEEE